MNKKLMLFQLVILFAILSFWQIKAAYCEPLSAPAQAAYINILQLAREAMKSPDMSRKDFEKRLSAILQGSDDDQKAARASAEVMFDSIEAVHNLNAVESQFDYAKIFDGKRYSSKQDIAKQKELLAEVNKITSASIKNGENSISRLEEEFKRAKLSPERIKSEIEGARQSEKESKVQVEKGFEKLRLKISLNEARIKVLDFLEETFGEWQFKNSFFFSTNSHSDQFKKLMAVVTERENAFAKFK